MDCSFEPEFTLEDWTHQLLAPLNKARYPLSATIELTERCNLNCLHCYINKAATDDASQSKELDTSTWKHVLDQMAEAGTLFLLITGGEPLLRPDFKQIFTHARRLGMLVTLFSNATLLTPEMANLLSDLSLHSLEVSLYGATQETYEKVTRQPGSFKGSMRGIELALSRGIKLSLKTVLLTKNQHELAAMQQLTESFGLDFRYDSTIWPRLDGSFHNMAYQVSDAKMLTLDTQDESRSEKWLEAAQNSQGYYLRSEKVFTCGAAYRSCHVDARGRMSPCMMVRKPAYDIPSMGFMPAFTKLGEVREWERQMHTECEACPVGMLCTQCPGWSLAFHGDYETPAEPVCGLGKLRANEFVKVAVL